MTQQQTTQQQQHSADDRAKAIDKVKKMLTLANDSGATADEAATAARMAQAWMRKFNLDHSEVIFDELKRGAGIAEEMAESASVNGGYIKDIPTWASVLASAACRLHDCHAEIRMGQKGKTIFFMGYEADVKVCAWLYKYLLDVVRKSAANVMQTDFSISQKRFRDSYRRGMSSELCARLAEMLKEKQRAEAVMSTSTALVVAKQKAIELHYGKTFTYTPVRSNRADGTAFAMGREAGSKVSINKPIGNSGSSHAPITTHKRITGGGAK